MNFCTWTLWICLPINIYLLKLNNRNTRKYFEISSKLTIKTAVRRQWCYSGAFFVTFQHISHHFLVFYIWPCACVCWVLIKVLFILNKSIQFSLIELFSTFDTIIFGKCILLFLINFYFERKNICYDIKITYVGAIL